METNEPRLLRAGFDTLDVAFEGYMQPSALDALRRAKALAVEHDRPQALELGPGRLRTVVQSHGMRGGYAFVLETGCEGVQWRIKDSLAHGWQLFASPRAACLLTRGFKGTVDLLFAQLEAMGATVTDHAVNRVDYALDVAMPEAFTPQPEQFVAPGTAGKTGHLSDDRTGGMNAIPPVHGVMRGRRWQSVTIGKMPGWQVIVYDKRAEAWKSGKLWALEACGLDPKEPVNLWRVELRAARHELRERWGLRHLREIEGGIGDAFARMVKRVRYLEDGPNDLNISRQRLHPLWSQVQAHICDHGPDWFAGLETGRVERVGRDVASMRYRANILGNLGGLAATIDKKDEDDALKQILNEIPAFLKLNCLHIVVKIKNSKLKHGWI